METGPFSGRTPRKRTYAIASDYLSVVPTDDGFGIFTTEEEALAAQILALESHKSTYTTALAIAKRRQRTLKRQKVPA